MMSRVLFILLGMLLFLPQGAGAQTNPLEAGGWVPYWRAATGTAEVLPHLSSLTVVHPFGYIVQEDGTIYDAIGMGTGAMAALQQAAQAQGVRFVPTVMWSDGPAMHAILSDATKRQALEDAIAALAAENGFDGVDIDFEAKLAETKPYFSLFLEGLYLRMGKRWVYCTIEPRTPIPDRYGTAVPPPDAGVYANDYTAINNYCDRVAIMAYDQGAVDAVLNRARGGAYAPVADIDWVRKVIQLAAQSINKNKLLIGIPTYGYEYAVEPQGSTYHYDVQWAFNPKYANDIAAAWGLEPLRTTGGELSLAYIPTSTPKVAGNAPVSSQAAGPAAAQAQPFNLLWWGDAVSAAQKVDLAKELGVRGVSVFKFDGGGDSRIWSVLEGR